MRTFTFVAALSTVVALALPAYGLSMKADDFIVPFERNSAMLTEEARKAVTRATEPFDKTTAMHFFVTAHEDAEEAVRGPRDLSKTRAEQVIRAMVAAGVPADRIEMKWMGASNLLVPTDEPEPLNRTVIIHVDF